MRGGTSRCGKAGSESKFRGLKSFFIIVLALVSAVFAWGIGPASAGPGGKDICPQGAICPFSVGFGTYFANSPAGFRTYPPAPDPGGITYYTGAPLRKFVDLLPGLGAANANLLGQYIPVAVADTTTYPGSDYYVIGLKDYTKQLHSDLPKPTRLRGYYQVNGTDHNSQYLGPLIIAKTYDSSRPAGVGGNGKPVRILFENHLGVGSAGNLSIPVDTTAMGAGYGPLGPSAGLYTQNRATLHLHGGNTPWISDGTPHQWVAPIGEYTTPYLKGVSQINVPDMPDPGQGRATFYYSNQQSSRLMFYHDHAYGITRLNVYAGEAAGYLLTDQFEEDLISGTNVTGVNPGLVKAIPDLGGVYHYGIPLIIQDKTFVPWDVAIEDAKWDTSKWGQPGDLWFPHVYETNQKPNSADGANPFGRWDYGPWFWPPVPLDPAHSTLPDPSMVPEAFMDTPIVNGTAYPYLPVEPKAYRFRILNACNDRMLNLQMYVAEPLHISVTSGGSGYSASPVVKITGGGGSGATATAVVTGGVISGVTITSGGSGYTSNPAVSFTNGGGSGAAGVALIAGGVVTEIIITSGGTGYTSAPDVSFTGGGGAGAAATASITTGVITAINVTNPGSGYTSAPLVAVTDSTGTGAASVASINTEVRMVPALPRTEDSVPPLCQKATATNPAGLALASIDPVTGRPLNETGLPANCWPTSWPIDGRDGGVPDPLAAGPAMIQIGTEGGFLPSAVVVPSTPVGYNYNRRDIVVLNVLNKALFLGPAERADIIVDFSAFAGKNIILYNDSPAPVPGFDPRNDYYTDDPDESDFGGAPSTLPGYGPNTRTIMQFRVGTTVTTPSTVSLSDLQTALPAVFNASQPAPHIPQTTYPAPNNAAADTYARIQDYYLNFTPVGLQAIWRATVTSGGSGYTSAPALNFVGGGGTGAAATAVLSGGAVTSITITSIGTGYTSPPAVNFTGGGGSGAAAVINFEPTTIPMQPKAIQELWDSYGRMNATLGIELPFTNNNTQTTIPLGYMDPATEIVPEGQTQIWKITHNGVDTHPVHFHLYNVQVINRVGWDGAIRPPEDNEIGWKETVRMNPLEDIIVALQPKTQAGLPFAVPDSIRSEDPTSDATALIPVIDPFGTLGGGQIGNATTVSNAPQNFGWEYVWHCHILGHEENDFMRSFVMLVPTAPPASPVNLTTEPLLVTLPATSGNKVLLNWTYTADAPPNVEIGFRIDRCSGAGCSDFAEIAKVYSGVTTYTDTLVGGSGSLYGYRVFAYNAAGDSAASNTSTITMPAWLPATGVNLSPDRPAPHLAGTPVLFTATGIGSTVPYQYRFWLNDGTLAGLGNIVQDYGSGNTWTLPASTIPGSYTISVEVRTDLSSPTADAYTSLGYQVILPPVPGPGAASVRIMPSAVTYSTIAAAFSAAAASDTIQAWGVLFNDGSVSFTTAGTVTFSGGYDIPFSTDPYMTTLQGTLTVAGIGGTLIVDRLIIR